MAGERMKSISLKIGQLSKRTGCHIETIRYYEREGIMPPPPRTAAGHRIYDGEHLERLTFIRRCRALGFPLADIRTLLHLSDGEGGACGEVRRLTLDHAAAIKRKIVELIRMEQVLLDMAKQCAGTAACPVIETLSTPD